MTNKLNPNDDKDKSAPVKGGVAPKGNEVPVISDDKFEIKPKYDEAKAEPDPWKGQGGAFTLDENGKRVPVQVPDIENRPLPPDAYPPPPPVGLTKENPEDPEEAPQDKTPK